MDTLTQGLEIPRELPFMKLPNAVLFPHALAPLLIFEPKYRRMLADCLRSHRMFGIVLTGQGHPGAEEGVSLVGSAGLIRACVGREDGTSNLVLQGLSRVRIQKFLPESPYPRALIKPLADHHENPAVLRRQADRLVELCGRLDQQGNPLPESLATLLESERDPTRLSDLLTCALIKDPREQQEVLEMRRASDRLRHLCGALERKLTP